jgi:hypothetical protein
MTPADRSALLRVALDIAARGVPVLPLSRGKRPVPNCPGCRNSACGDRPHMLAAGPCACPYPCHAWAAATTDPAVITSPQWARAWAQAGGIAYHPGGAEVTVVDLDTEAAVAWARTALPATVTVTTGRGEHWIYRGAMQSANGVRPGVDIKSSMSYARWLGPGAGRMAGLPEVVRALAVKEPAAARPVAASVTGAVLVGGGVCCHRVPAYLDRGIAMAVERISEARSAVHATVYGTFLAVLSVHGRCGCLTDAHVGRLFTAAQAKGESPRHCVVAWSNARTRLGM